jgi:hypothetical protein
MPEFTSSLSEHQLVELINLAGKLFDEAERCACAGQWRPAMLLLGGAVEAGIVATATCLEPELRSAGVWPRNGAPTDWTLGQAARLAIVAGWFPTAPREDDSDSLFAALRGEVGDAIQFLIAARNMVVHPAAHVCAEERPDLDDPGCMRPTYELLRGIALAVFAHMCDPLESLRPAAG